MVTTHTRIDHEHVLALRTSIIRSQPAATMPTDTFQIDYFGE